jgi:hypothetical protein
MTRGEFYIYAREGDSFHRRSLPIPKIKVVYVQGGKIEGQEVAFIVFHPTGAPQRKEVGFLVF